MDREVIKLKTNVPRIVRLDHGPHGKETVSRISGEPQWMYTVDDDAGVMWVSAMARAALIRSGAQAGDDVRILKTKKGGADSFAVDVVQAGAAAAQPAPRAVNGPPAYQPNYENDQFAPARGAHQNDYAPARRLEQEARTTRSEAEAVRELERISVPYDTAPPQPQVAPQPAAERKIQVATEVHPITQRMATCLRSAIDACHDAQEYARGKQFGITFTSEDVRAIGLSVYIGLQRNGGGR